MPNANITATPGTQTGNFNVMVTVDVPINALAKTNVNLRALTENGVTGIDFEIMGSGKTFNLPFSVPSNVEGSFEIALTGTVTPQGGSSPEAIMANTLKVMYDSTVNVTASFGTVEYREDGVIAIPVNFVESVIAPAKSICEVTYASGDKLTGVDYRLIGKNRDFELVFKIPHDRKGSFRVGITGDVFKVATHVWDNVIIPAMTINYDTRVPYIVDYDIPEIYAFGKNFDVRIALNAPSTGWHVDNTFTEIFIEEGARLGTPTPYKWTGAEPSDLRAFLQTDLPDDLTGTDWQQLATPPAGAPTPNSNGFDADGQWHGEEGQYFLFRINVSNADAVGVAQFTLRPNSLRGPIS